MEAVLKLHSVEASQNGSRFSYGLALLALSLLFFLVNARWTWIYRHGQPLDIDEAGYLSIALIDYYALIRASIVGWLSAVCAPSVQAPLTTALSSLLFYFTGPHVIVGFVVPLLAGTGCIVATYFLGKSVGSRQIGLAASILVASCPVILNYSRSFHFSLPATLAVTIALLALLNSDRFERIGWSVLFGLSLGLVPLARTMTVAFIPGIIVAALVYTVAQPFQRTRRLLVFTASLLLAVLTAATWFGPNGSLVYRYLFNFGYGSRAVEFGPERSRFGFDAWWDTLWSLGSEIYLPHLVIIVAGGVAMLIVAYKEARKVRSTALLQRVLRSPMLPILIVVFEALLALTSSRNKGSAFFAPIVPMMLVTAVWALFRISSHRRYNLAVISVIAAIAIMASMPLIDLRTPLASPWTAFGYVRVTDGRGAIQEYEAWGGFGPTGIAEPISPDRGKAWINLDRETAAIITRMYGSTAKLVFGFRHRLYNVNTVNLQQLLTRATTFAAQQVEPIVTGDSVEGYLSWLASEDGACALLTSDKTSADFTPVVNRTYMRDAADRAGFTPIQEWPTPDGQIITLWQSRPLPPNCGPALGPISLPSLMKFVSNVRLGNKFGTVQDEYDMTLFVHPGQDSPTIFDLKVGELADVSGCRRIALKGRMDPKVSREAIARGGAIVDLIVRRKGESFHSVVSVAADAEVSLEPSANEAVEIEVGNHGNPDTDWFNLRTVLSACN
jgi:hypothetical protein